MSSVRVIFERNMLYFVSAIEDEYKMCYYKSGKGFTYKDGDISEQEIIKVLKNTEVSINKQDYLDYLFYETKSEISSIFSKARKDCLTPDDILLGVETVIENLENKIKQISYGSK